MTDRFEWEPDNEPELTLEQRIRHLDAILLLEEIDRERQAQD